ncbi:MAG TPA: DUF1499 domain-containing protein [Xanthomonadaceae bacterium]|nr:DUF1499 domain-containing protein [Xanthomonadaceae bacterium]
MSLILKIPLALLALLLALLLLAIAWGLVFGLPGRAPAGLGMQSDGRLAPCRSTPNCVSSFAGGGYHAIEPLPLRGRVEEAMARLRRQLEAMPGMRIEQAGPGYLYVTQRTRWLGFVDDVEFLADVDQGVVHVRSASRLGRKDFGVNRARIESVRRALADQS